MALALQGPRLPPTQLAVPPQVPHETAVAASLFDQLVVDLLGVQIWQELLGLLVPLAMNAAAIQHPSRQLPAVQIFTPPQVCPSESFDHTVGAATWQLWQALLGSVEPDA